MHGHQVRPRELTAPRIEQYLKARRRAGYRAWVSERGLTPLLDFLRRLQVVPAPRLRMARTALDRLLVRYGDYLRRERGLVPSYVRVQEVVARRFLLRHCHPERLDARDVEADAQDPANIAPIAKPYQPCTENAKRANAGRDAYMGSGLRYGLYRSHTTALTPPMTPAIPSRQGHRPDPQHRERPRRAGGPAVHGDIHGLLGVPADRAQDRARSQEIVARRDAQGGRYPAPGVTRRSGIDRLPVEPQSRGDSQPQIRLRPTSPLYGSSHWAASRSTSSCVKVRPSRRSSRASSTSCRR